MKTYKLPTRHHKQNPSRRLRGYIFFLLTISILLCPSFALATSEGGDPLTVINNLSEFIFAANRAVGLILLGLGIVQIGLSMKSHDPSQRAQGILTFFGGLLITFAKEILNLVMGS
jgi:hypothetical protein